MTTDIKHRPVRVWLLCGALALAAAIGGGAHLWGCEACALFGTNGDTKAGDNPKSVVVDGMTVWLVKDFRTEVVPPDAEFEGAGRELGAPGERGFRHVLPKPGARFYRSRGLCADYALVAEMQGQKFRLYPEAAGKFFDVIDSADKATELVELTMQETVISDAAFATRLAKRCKATNPEWVWRPLPRVTGGQRLRRRPALYLVSLLLHDEHSVVAVRYVVDEQGHMTYVDRHICLGPTGTPPPRTVDGLMSGEERRLEQASYVAPTGSTTGPQRDSPRDGNAPFPDHRVPTVPPIVYRMHGGTSNPSDEAMAFERLYRECEARH